MSYLYAHVRPNNIYKVLQTDIIIYKPANELITESVTYNPDTLLEENSWHRIEKFSETEHVIPLLSRDYSSVDFDDLPEHNFERIDYLFSISQDNNEMYFQKVGKAALISKKRIWKINGSFSYDPVSSSIIINEQPDAIYIKDIDTLFFKKLPSINSIFTNMNELYREATQEETRQFLNIDSITTENFTADKVHTLNRKRINEAIETYNNLNAKQKNDLSQYIISYCPELQNNQGKLNVKNNDDLALVLYGINQRFYTTNIGEEEKRIANSVIKLG